MDSGGDSEISRALKELNPSWWERAKRLLLLVVTLAVILAPFLAMAYDRFYFPTNDDFGFKILLIDSCVCFCSLIRLPFAYVVPYLFTNRKWVHLKMQMQLSTVTFLLLELSRPTQYSQASQQFWMMVTVVLFFL